MSIFATSGTLANDRVSCPHFAILKISHISEMTAHRTELISILTPRDGGYICATSGILTNYQVLCLNMANFVKFTRISETAAHRAKNKLNFTPTPTPGVEKKCVCNF